LSPYTDNSDRPISWIQVQKAATVTDPVQPDEAAPIARRRRAAVLASDRTAGGRFLKAAIVR
jgi:hypothetical protein